MISSPCIKICTMDTRAGVCAGCGRTLDEIARWGTLAESERLLDRPAAGGVIKCRGQRETGVAGEREDALRLRMATAMIYGDTDAQREATLTAPDPLAAPAVAAALDRLAEILTDLSP